MDEAILVVSNGFGDVLFAGVMMAGLATSDFGRYPVPPAVLRATDKVVQAWNLCDTCRLRSAAGIST